MTVAPVGEWESPITSELITASSISLGAPRLSPDGAYVYYLEGRPTEKGRQVLCRQCEAPATPCLPLLSVRSPLPRKSWQNFHQIPWILTSNSGHFSAAVYLVYNLRK